MPIQDRLRLQIRIVQIVYRAESARIVRRDALASGQSLAELSSRSLAILQNVRAQLDGDALWHADLTSAIIDLEAEIGDGGVSRIDRSRSI